MSAMASEITSLIIACSTVYSGAYQRKHHSSASLAFVWVINQRPVNSPHKWPVTRKMFPFDDVIVILRSPLGLYVLFHSLIRLNNPNAMVSYLLACTHNGKNTVVFALNFAESTAHQKDNAHGSHFAKFGIAYQIYSKRTPDARVKAWRLFWRNNDVIIALCVRWFVVIMCAKHSLFPLLADGFKEPFVTNWTMPLEIEVAAFKSNMFLCDLHAKCSCTRKIPLCDLRHSVLYEN